MNIRGSKVATPQTASLKLSVGIDIVQISRVEESLVQFGDRFVRRLFSSEEASYAQQAPGLLAQRLAARFAAKEATIKAFNLSHVGVNWRDIEVVRSPSGACSLRFHGLVADLVQACGRSDITLSLSHDGDYAAAVVAATAPH